MVSVTYYIYCERYPMMKVAHQSGFVQLCWQHL